MRSPASRGGEQSVVSDEVEPGRRHERRESVVTRKLPSLFRRGAEALRGGVVVKKNQIFLNLTLYCL
jgi:hypothetical protein